MTMELTNNESECDIHGHIYVNANVHETMFCERCGDVIRVPMIPKEKDCPNDTSV